MSIVIALDEGTTNAKAVAIDGDGRVLAHASRGLGIRNTAPGWTEQDALEIREASVEVLARVLAQVPADEVIGLAISNQRESVVAWDPVTGTPAGPVLSWQDTRTADRCAALAQVHGDRVLDLTGLPLDPMFSAPKMAWLLEQAPDGTVVGTVDSWLVWCLTGGSRHVSEAGNASRTLLMDLATLDWHPELLGVFGIPREALPEIVASNGDLGSTACDGLPAGIPILALMADSHAALRGHGGGEPGVVKATYGTGSSVMQGTGAQLRRRPGVATTLAWLDDRPVYALEGNIRYSGSALDWTARLLGVADARSLGALAATVDDADGVVLVPAFGGLGAPHWDPTAVGTLTGLGAGSGPAQVARAAFDAVAHQVADVAEAMLAEGEALEAVRADGGATASELLMQTQADALGCEVVVVGEADVALRGVAAVAFAQRGIALPAAAASRTHRPSYSAQEREAARARWRAALDRSKA
ncbi:FGGY family carbohydrate kinase [Demequina capsici]|uniref:ATP:glycerol 3-phosphotransferase n=1 Tax=Demequina capsici TaxID=3075620 RepID=A0AA96FDH6_9MICO|nr:FGGY family carbohydrate kinase [Demequina sp. PMTSA13]WNM27572.1 FGGY family carbohydrate kinase [Demequina sp. PMTSA13]